MKTLIVIDMQKDFIDGSLGSTQAQVIVENVAKIIEDFRKEKDNKIIFTRDTHREDYLSTQEGKKLPVIHCIEDSDGWQIDSRLNTEDAIIVDKGSFGSLELVEVIREKCKNTEKIVLVGLCTDICVISNAMILKAAFPETEISVLSDCCAGVSEESHNTALSAMNSCQINIE